MELTIKQKAKLWQILEQYDNTAEGQVRDDIYGEFSNALSKVIQGKEKMIDLMVISDFMDFGKIKRKDFFDLEDIVGKEITAIYIQV